MRAIRGQPGGVLGMGRTARELPGKRSGFVEACSPEVPFCRSCASALSLGKAPRCHAALGNWEKYGKSV